MSGDTLGVSKSVLICATHRSGSFWLSDLLNQTGKYGNITECFNYKKSKTHFIEIPRPYRASFEMTVKEGTTDNGVFGGKILFPQLANVEEGFQQEGLYEGVSGFEILNQELPNLLVIRLKRRNRIRQAISYYRAHYSKKWWKSGHEGDDQPFDVDYLGLKHIRAIAFEIERWERSWDDILRKSTAPRVEVIYEDILSNSDEELNRIFQFIGGEKEQVILANSKFIRQSDRYTEIVYEKFVQFDEGKTAKLLQRAI